MSDIYDNIALKIAFSQAKGVCGATAREVIERLGGDIAPYFSLSQAELHNLTGISNGIFDDEYRASLLDFGTKEAAILREKCIDALFIDSDGYPARLSNCEDAPVLLYQFGSCHLDAAHSVGIVGTRHATPYGIEMATKIVNVLAEKIDDLIIVSGLAYGIDVAAHRAALNAGVRTVGVLAHGLSRIYPAQHRDIAARMAASGGALVTEYTYATAPLKSSFLARNRIIAGLCDCVIVVESDIKGGAMSTARTAMNYNRDVFAVPGRVNDRFSKGTNMLIANHIAALVENADDVIRLMGWTPKSHTDTASETNVRLLSDDEQMILDYITKHPDATINDICVHLNIPFATATDLMFALEMDDIVITIPGGRFVPTSR